jgi:hypothetical protein
MTVARVSFFAKHAFAYDAARDAFRCARSNRILSTNLGWLGQATGPRSLTRIAAMGCAVIETIGFM